MKNKDFTRGGLNSYAESLYLEKTNKIIDEKVTSF